MTVHSLLHNRQQTMEAITVRVARLDDLDQLIGLYELFFEESDLPTLGLNYDPSRMRIWLVRSIRNGSPHIVAVERATEKLVGVLCYAVDFGFTEQPYAYLDKFYVRREWRRSAVGRVLLACALELAKNDGAVAFRAGLSSGIAGADNVFRKLGFSPTKHSVLLARRI
jgi:GNAT superfamily N-acetyltransferase